MTEDEAQAWITGRFGADASARVGRFLELVVAENEHQNLISPATIPRIWARHALDCAQLIGMAPAAGTWLDIGSGGGFPGMIVALMRPCDTVLIEPRRRRAEFLVRAAMDLGVSARVLTCKVENADATGAVISARAVASIDKLLLAAQHCAVTGTRWLLPRGRLTTAEIDDVRRHWAGTFHVEQSLTDPASSILVAHGVERR